MPRFREDPQDVTRRYESARDQRYNYDNQWHEIAARIWPEQDNFLLKRSPGEKRTEFMYESTGAIALERFAAVLESLLTPRSQRWSRLKASSDELNEDSAVREWFDTVNSQLFRMRAGPRANFYNQMHEGHKNLGAFGNACIYVDDEPGVGVRYRQCGIGDTFMETSPQGIPDTIFYRYELTAKAAVQQWKAKVKAGVATMPASAVKDLDTAPFQKRTYLHAVYPREAFDARMQRPSDMPYVSVHLDLDAKELIYESGYETQPYLFSRYTVNATEHYGRGPAMITLPTIRMLQDIQKVFVRAGHLSAEPPLLLAKSGIVGHGSKEVSLRPGQLNWGGLNAQGQQMIQPLLTGANMPLTEAMLERERQVVNSFFLVDLFQTLVESPSMTATEVLIRLQEKGQLIAPMIGRQQSELLGPLNERELQIIGNRGELPPLPGALIEAQGEYEIVYENQAQRMQRTEELQGIMRTVEAVAPFAQFDPGIMEMFDAEQIVRTSQEITGAPPSILRTKDEYAQIRQQQAEQQQAQQQMDMLSQAAPAVEQLAGVANAAEAVPV